VAPAQEVTSGALQYENGPALTIDHAVAYEYLIPEELRGNPSGNHRLHILLGDRPAAPQAAADEGAFLRAVQGKGLRRLYLEIDLPDLQWNRISVARPDGEVESTGLGLDGSEFMLSGVTVEAGMVSGRVRTTMRIELPDRGDGAIRYAFDIRFSAPIARAPIPTQRLSGAEARNSPQAAALIAMAELLTSNDLARIRSGLHPRLPFAQGLRTGDAAARAAVAQARKLVGSPAALRAGIRHVLVYGDRAVVVTRGAEGDGRLVVERENGAWVVAAQDQPYRQGAASRGQNE
jgi:hypothetical protein